MLVWRMFRTAFVLVSVKTDFGKVRSLYLIILSVSSTKPSSLQDYTVHNTGFQMPLQLHLLLQLG